MKNVLPHHLLWKDIVKLSLRTFRRRSLRSILTIIGVSVGIGVVLFVVSLGFGFQKIIVNQIIKTDDSLFSLEASFSTETSVRMHEKDIQDIKSLKGVAEISPIADFSGELIYNETNGLVKVRIVDENYFRLAGKIPDVGSSFQNKDSSFVISSGALRLFGIEPTKETLSREFKIVVQISEDTTFEFVIPLKGIILDENESPYILLPRSLVDDFPLSYKSVFVRAQNADFVLVIRDILVNRGILISAKLDLIAQTTKVLNILTIILSVFGITTLIVSAIGMFNVMTVALLERTYEIGIMKALGALDTDIRKLFLTEAFSMGFFGGILGLLIGIGFADLFNLGINTLARSLHGNSVSLFERPLWFMGGLVLFSSLISLLTGYWPARRSMRLSPIEAFKK